MTAQQRLKISFSRMLQQPLFNRVTRRIAHLVAPPLLHDIYRNAETFTGSAVEAVQAVLGTDVDYRDEYEQLRERIVQEPDNYPGFYMVEDATAYLLYSLVRHTKPALTIEVGVADGRSTQTILAALDANDGGRLISVDIDSDVGGAAKGHPRWSLRVHDPNRPSGPQLRRLLVNEEAPDLFFHDGSHTFYDQYEEYLAALEAMRPGSVFVSDDIDWSTAFLDVAKVYAVRPVVLAEGRKAVGLFLRPGEAAP